MSDDQDDIGSRGKSVALEARNTGEDGRRYSPSAARNSEAIADVLAEHMPVAGHILEIASGTGEHGARFVERFPDLRWTYSDLDEISLSSQAAWIAQADAGDRLAGPLRIDATRSDWGDAERPESFDGMYCANMVHIAPFEAAEGLIKGAGRLLKPGGKLMLYGPFAQDGEIAPSNSAFSEDLKRRDESWGVRDLVQEVLPLAVRAGLTLERIVDMPANNLSVIFRKT
ncbi:DUF938 domain-containing protein [Henriciella barbarensis]|uniref:DUF938 domain-containing protein n=1 Tax=Henriciella barbarensis TaxID=86342 RepID=A0A399QPU8_9PROT|nr:DUF938 domain-containing protein [Henriciella barbarensis]RIJ20511.1 DUF938 domain-containing protein [Henriciella barbarensis]